ncbi:MAG: alpha-amylase family glycosyl hydrolase [Syntrophobacteraceae bacterium]
MYEQFGAYVPLTPNPNGKTTVEFRIYFPGPSEYWAAGGPRIDTVKVAGTFQQREWELASAPVLRPATVSTGDPAARGVLHRSTKVDLPPGYYEYKFWVQFANGDERWVSDPCALYGGASDDNAAFVVGGNWPPLKKLDRRLPIEDLILYELMIDDFAAEIVAADPSRAPLEAVRDKLAYLEDLGVNAISFMPWTAWPGGAFSWGYNPAFYFSVEHRYMRSTARPLDKLALLRELINACHERGMHVIMDGVFNHAEGGKEAGFPYIGLYEQEFESPFVGTFAGGGFFKNLDFNNECTHHFVFDACRYWIEEFGIDGIRFDYTLGFWHWDDRGHGLNRLLFDIRHHLRDLGEENFALILEHMSDNRYDAINVTNQVGATGCWFDPFMNVSHRMLDRAKRGEGEIVDMEILRVLDGAREFDQGRRPVAYIENHDHTRVAHVAGGRVEWARTQPYAIALFTSPGTPMIYNGQEFGEDHDVPDSGPDRVSSRPLRWRRLSDGIGEGLHGLYRKLTSIRKAHPILRGPNVFPTWQPDWARDFNQEGYGVSRNLDAVVYRRWGDAPGGGRDDYVVVLNFSSGGRRVRFLLPSSGLWEDLLSGWTFQAPGDMWWEMEVGSNWGHIFHRRA